MNKMNKKTMPAFILHMKGACDQNKVVCALGRAV